MIIKPFPGMLHMVVNFVTSSQTL